MSTALVLIGYLQEPRKHATVHGLCAESFILPEVTIKIAFFSHVSGLASDASVDCLNGNVPLYHPYSLWVSTKFGFKKERT